MGGGSSSGLFPLLSFAGTCIKKVKNKKEKKKLNYLKYLTLITGDKHSAAVVSTVNALEVKVLSQTKKRRTGRNRRISSRAYSFSLWGDLCAFVHCFDP